MFCRVTGKRGHAAGRAAQELAAASDHAHGLGAQQLDDLQQQRRRRLLLAQPPQQRLQQPGERPAGQRPGRPAHPAQPQLQGLLLRPPQAQEHTEPEDGPTR